MFHSEKELKKKQNDVLTWEHRANSAKNLMVREQQKRKEAVENLKKLKSDHVHEMKMVKQREKLERETIKQQFTTKLMEKQALCNSKLADVQKLLDAKSVMYSELETKYKLLGVEKKVVDQRNT